MICCATFPIIGFAGFGQVGKDTACRLLKENAERKELMSMLNTSGIKRVAFADALKADVQHVIDEFSEFGDTNNKEVIRPLWIAVGKVGRAVCPDMWIRRADSVILKALRNHFTVCITDVRYRNEAKYIFDNGGCVFRLCRDGYGPASDEEEESISEMVLAYPHIPVIENNGNFSQLLNAVIKELTQLREEFVCRSR